MRPTFLGFETARKGLAVNQKGLDIVGHNLTNVHTAGYTRQRVDMYSVSPNTFRTRYAETTGEFAGQGVAMSGVSQVRDSFLDRRFRDEYSQVGYYDQVSAILDDVECAIDEYDTDTGLKNAIKGISNALSEFASNPDSKVHANVVSTAFKNIVQTLHQFDSKLSSVAAQQKNDLGIAVNNVNDIISKIVGLNKTISADIAKRSNSGEYYGPNELLDERNLLLDELSKYGDINVKQNADGTVKVNMSGRDIIEGTKKETLNYVTNNDGTVSLTWNTDGKRYSSPSGSLQGYIDMINGRGPYAKNENESSEKGILFFKDKIDIFANTFANTFNHIIPKLDSSGNIAKNGDDIVYRNLLGSRTVEENGNIKVKSDVLVTASNISLSDEWSNDANYVIFKQGQKDPRYVNAMSAALSSNKQSFIFEGSSTNMTFEDFVNDYVGVCGSTHSFNSGRLEASAAIADDLLDRRDEVSAVNPDEETTNMMLYNKSYQAVARLMTSLDEALDILINRTGMVGR